MAQQTINYGTNPNDGTGDTLRDAFIKTDDNFTDLYDNKLSLTGTEVGAPITGMVTFDDDQGIVLQNSAGAGLGAEISGSQFILIGENGAAVETTLSRVSFNGNNGSIIKDVYTYGDGQQTFNYPTLGSTDNFNVNWPAKGGTVAMTSDITAGSGTVTSVGLTAGTSGTDINISGSPITTSGSITLNIPTASASHRGALSSSDWSMFNAKGNGTVTSVAALTLGTTGTDLSSTVANGTTTPVITLNVPTASASNRGALSSADWTTFNNKATILHKTGAASATHTGTTANTLISSFQIDANSIADNQNIEFEFKANKINTTSGTVNFRAYINTSASLTGATLIGTYNLPSATSTQSFSFRRLFVRRSGTLLVHPAGDSAQTDYTTITGAVIGSPTVDFTVNQFLIIAAQLAATGQQIIIESVLIQRI